MRHLALGLLLAAGCSGSNDPASLPGGGDSDTVTGCAAGQVLDGHGSCIGVCRRESDCLATETCNLATGLCLPDPTAVCVEAACPARWVCPDDGSPDCVPGPGGCAGDGDCNFGERCDASRCVSRAGEIVQTCTVDGECPLLMTCQLGVCFGCFDDLQCSLRTAGARCVAGACVTADLGPAGACLTLECPDGQRCSLATGQCEPTCTANTDCAVDEVCAPVLSRCVKAFGCASDQDCVTAGLTCVTGFGDGVCTGCSDTVPCKSGLTCVVGACLPDLGASPCDQAACAVDESCDARDGSCYPSDGTCADATDCRSGHVCNFLGLCSGCSVDGDCRPNQRCLFATCVPL